MNFQTKFDVGQRVWQIIHGAVDDMCPTCHGDPIAQDKDNGCPTCGWNGYVSRYFRMPLEFVVSGVHCHHNGKGETIVEYDCWRPTEVPPYLIPYPAHTGNCANAVFSLECEEAELYATEEEATLALERRS